MAFIIITEEYLLNMIDIFLTIFNHIEPNWTVRFTVAYVSHRRVHLASLRVGRGIASDSSLVRVSDCWLVKDALGHLFVRSLALFKHTLELFDLLLFLLKKGLVVDRRVSRSVRGNSGILQVLVAIGTILLALGR